MGATFGANDGKDHLFTLMGFNAHHNKIHITWVITSQKTVDDLVEWFKALKKKILVAMHLIGNQVVSLMMTPLKSHNGGEYKSCITYFFLIMFIEQCT